MDIKRMNSTSTLILSLPYFFIPSSITFAADSTWTGATSSAWATAGNWSAGVPGLPVGASTDKATFTGTTPNNTIANNGVSRTLATFEFSPTAVQYTITNTVAGGAFTLGGLGIVNNSLNTQIITNTRNFTFTNSADAGSNVLFNNNAGLEIKNPHYDSLKITLDYQGIFAENVTNNGVLCSLNWSFN